jgi:1-deoxy-D-xylulose-5-phosphate reductoisomerase
MVDNPTPSLVLLGSTGSIGVQSLSVCRERGFPVLALAANRNVALLEKQARAFLPSHVAVADPAAYPALKTALADTSIRLSAGREALCELATLPEADIAVNAVVGIAGLRPTLAALEAGNAVALANKEALIAGGSLVMERAVLGESLFPIDSEHSAIWQCLQAGSRGDVTGILLTASGGPFFGKTREELAAVTVEQTLRHPNWDMGAKITVDSATLMNKGLELIEAMWLFGLTPSQVKIVVHRQSIVHSAVEFADGSVIAQLGVPDMRLAIQYALTYPYHLPLTGKRLSLTEVGSLTFEKPAPATFACLAACMRAADRGGLAPCIANGANEEAVAYFLAGKIGFLQIGELVAAAVEELSPTGSITLEAIEQADCLARDFVRDRIG